MQRVISATTNTISDLVEFILYFFGPSYGWQMHEGLYLLNCLVIQYFSFFKIGSEWLSQSYLKYECYVEFLTDC